jgi:hypothetical protein
MPATGPGKPMLDDDVVKCLTLRKVLD